MARLAKRVYVDPIDTARLDTSIDQLAENTHVRIVDRSGAVVSGIVSERPVLQLFQTIDGVEGANAIVRIEHPDTQATDDYVWLDEIERLERLDPL